MQKRPPLAARLSLRGDPGVFQTLGSRGSSLRQQLQHGQEEGAELGRVLLAPLVLVQQDLQQAPRLQLCDASQLSCRGQTLTVCAISPVNVPQRPPECYPCG